MNCLRQPFTSNRLAHFLPQLFQVRRDIPNREPFDQIHQRTLGRQYSALEDVWSHWHEQQLRARFNPTEIADLLGNRHLTARLHLRHAHRSSSSFPGDSGSLDRVVGQAAGEGIPVSAVGSVRKSGTWRLPLSSIPEVCIAMKYTQVRRIRTLTPKVGWVVPQHSEAFEHASGHETGDGHDGVARRHVSSGPWLPGAAPVRGPEYLTV